MNIATSEPSLYQLTQDLDEPLVPLSVGAETLQSYVSSVIELLIKEQLQATVWVKLPQTKSWLNQIQRLCQEGNTKSIVVCSNQRNHSALSLLKDTSAKTPVVSIKLNQNSTLQRESFLIVLATDFCSLTLAQWQKSKIEIDASGKRLQQPYLEMVSSFAPQAIAPILLGIKHNTVFSASLKDQDFSINPQVIVRTDLIGKLVLQQVSQNERVQTAFNSSLSRTSHLREKSLTVLGLQSDFLSNLVQELRSPITHMKTALSLLESKQIKGEQRQRYLQMLSEQCDRQNSLIGGLLGLLQLDTPTKAEYLRLDDIVPGIVSTYQPLAEEKDIQLGYTIPANLLPISCPRPWFRQIIINLLNNSLQFTPPKGKVFVQAALKNDNEQIEILIMDTGVGIATKEINKIFDGFYRTKPTTEDKATGAGLGLTLVKQLIQRCGGSIAVSSKVGKGTTFKILLPAIPAELS
ncbi:MAG TPA: ATP-binding protein [Coleofasciculaceae cyanobacterium]|jgi:signal transduction histidine kinase